MSRTRSISAARTRGRFSGACALAALAGATLAPLTARGQTPPPPDTQKVAPSSDPQLRGESVESTLEAMRKRAEDAGPAVAPAQTRTPATAPPVAGRARATGAEPGSDFGGSRRIREGAFLTRRGGTMLRARTGDWIFVPRPLDDGTVDVPLVLLPSRSLERLEAAIGPAADRPRVSVSGQVFTYRDREYLLASEATGLEPEDPAPAPGPAPAAESPGAAEARVEDLVKELETRRTLPRSLPRGLVTTAPAEAENGAEPGAETPPPPGPGSAVEGTLITGRRGRMIRTPDGDLAFAFDNDVEARGDRALALVPCATLSRMESVSLWRSDGVVLEVSGRILVYRGTRYLLPTMFVVPPAGDVVPLQ